MSDPIGKDPEYIYHTAMSYILGDGVPRDSKKGAELLQVAADMNYLPAVRDLGILYLNGDGVPPDGDKAYALISRTAAQMDPNSVYHLSLMYEKGFGVPKDLYQALKLMAFCAAANYPGAPEEADRIEAEIDAERVAKLDFRPLLHLEISDTDIEACCCKRMLDAVKDKDIYSDNTVDGPAIFGADENGEEIVLKKCPFCGAEPIIVPHSKVY